VLMAAGALQLVLLLHLFPEFPVYQVQGTGRDQHFPWELGHVFVGFPGSDFVGTLVSP